MQTSRRTLIGALGGAMAGSLTQTVRAQEWPDKPIRMIVPYPAGGGADSWARIVSSRLEKLLGQPIVLDYRPGASTTIGNEAGARAAPDGYTVLLYDSSGFAYVPNMRKVGYEPIKAFVPLAHLGAIPFVFVAHPRVPAVNMAELVAYARANPGKLNCASAGVGSPHHLIAELFKARARVSMNHVPYKGAAQYVADLLGGQVDLAVSTIGPAAQHIQSGKLKALGVSTLERSSALPEVPSIAEQGFPGFDEKPWNCFVAPTGLPPLPLERLRAAFRTALADPDALAALRKAGIEGTGSIPLEQVSQAMADDLAKWGEVIRRANITLEG